MSRINRGSLLIKSRKFFFKKFTAIAHVYLKPLKQEEKEYIGI